tara:strand:+ start:1669 stop:1995 length:327 start_codon:yes stop_codon:yes gene_type:complete
MSWNLDDNTKPILDPHQESKPKLTREEIEKAAKVHASFVDPRNQIQFSSILYNRFHRDTYHAFHKLSYMNNRNPVDHPYSVDQYIIDKSLALKICENTPCYCGACECK